MSTAYADTYNIIHARQGQAAPRWHVLRSRPYLLTAQLASLLGDFFGLKGVGADLSSVTVE